MELECGPEEKDILIAELWEQGSAGIEEIPSGLRGFFETDCAALLERFRAFSPQCREEESCDWIQLSRDNWEPLAVGERFFLVPSWRSDPTPAGRIRIEINPGLACGSGAHPATQLCLEALERNLAPGMTVLDVGTGSGILAIAAAFLGARQVIACDIDRVAVEIALRNVTRAPAPQVSILLGSIESLRDGCADLLAVNIGAEALAANLVRCLKPGGVILASGFETWRREEAVRRLQAQGGWVRAAFTKGDWLLLEVVTRLKAC